MRKISSASLSSLVVLIVATFPLPQSHAAPPSEAQTQAPAQPTNQSTSTKPSAKNSVVYVNRQYGFRLYLPKSWKGYSILVETWEGGRVNDRVEGKAAQPETGPKIIIRHPLWTNRDPRQDIPIMIFTRAQWKLVQNEDLIVSAAPFSPGELAHNAHYVFALPPRYNYGFETGYEEVDEILGRNSLRPF